MMYTWNILVGGKNKGVVRSTSEGNAIMQFYMTYGSVSRYDENGVADITAIRLD
jgi:hypothetical protein